MPTLIMMIAIPLKSILCCGRKPVLKVTHKNFLNLSYFDGQKSNENKTLS